MTFLNPSVLYALPAVALPLLIHFFARRRAKILPFSSLRFLKELQQTEIRRFRLREWLLLLLRTLAVALAVLAFARPAQVPPGVNPKAVGSRIVAALVLDDSYSMQVATPRGSLFQEACDRVEQVLATLGPADAAVVVRPRGKAWKSKLFPVRNPGMNKAKERWAEEPRGAYDTDLVGGVESAADWFTRFPGARRELYVVSDFAGQPFASEDSTLRLRLRNWQVFLVPVSARTVPNAGVRKVTLESQILEPGAAVQVVARVVNTGTEKLDERLVQLSWQGRPVDQTTVTLKPGQGASVRLRVIPATSGWQFGAVSVEDDALATDNTFWFAVQVPGKLKVLVVAGTRREAEPVAVALAPPGAEHRIYSVTVKSPSQVATADLRNADAVFLVDVNSLPAVGWAEIVRFVRQGGTLVVFPGPQVEPRVLSQQLLGPLGLPPLGETLGSPGAAVPVLTLGRVDLTHPLFQGVFEKKAQITSPAFYVVLHALSSPRIQPVLSYSDGSPMLYEAAVDAGEVFVFTTGVDTSWSDLTRRGLFVPLVVRLPIYGRSKGQNAVIPSKVGDRLKLVDQRLSLENDYAVRRPNGVEVKLMPRAVGGGILLQYDDTDVPGVYQLLAGGELVHIWAVNPEPAETNLKQADVKALAARLGAHVIPPSAKLDQFVNATRRGRELWPYLSALLFLALLAETLLARTRPAEDETREPERALEHSPGENV